MAGNKSWSDVLGNGMSAVDIVNQIGEDETVISAWLMQKYTELARDNPHGGWDEPLSEVDAYGYAEDIVEDAHEIVAEQARQRVTDSDNLRDFEEVIFTDWDNWYEHMKWIANAPEKDIMDWAQGIIDDEMADRELQDLEDEAAEREWQDWLDEQANIGNV